jgi:hypothetical protein
MMRRAVTSIVAVSIVLGMAIPAAAATPQLAEEVPFAITVEDLDGDQCGFPIRWEITGTARDLFFTDDSGALVRIISRVEEENLVTNLDTSATAVDRPKFTQIVDFRADGSLESITTVGLFLNAGTGTDQAKDVGRFVWAVAPDGERTLQFAAGPHALLEQSPTRDFQEWLGALCATVD